MRSGIWNIERTPFSLISMELGTREGNIQHSLRIGANEVRSQGLHGVEAQGVRAYSLK